MIYTSRFYNIYDELFLVTIRTATGTNVTSITLADDPFTVQWKGSSDDLYKPVRCSGATLRVVSSSYHFDMYAAAIGDVTVLVQKKTGTSYSTVWSGYVTPNAYDQGFDTHLEVIEIECIDHLSAMKYFKYEDATPSTTYPSAWSEPDVPSSGQKWVYRTGTGAFLAPTFYDVIAKCLSRAECPGLDTEFIYGPFPRIGAGGTAPAQLLGLHHLRVMNENFFEEKEGDEDEPKAWTCLEVLESLNRYLGTTMYCWNGRFYMINWDSVIRLTEPCPDTWGTSTAIMVTGPYTANTGTNVNPHNYADQVSLTPYVLTDSRTVVLAGVKTTYSKTGTSLSLDEVYNKVSVKAKPHTFDEIIPDPFDSPRNITASTDPGITGTWELSDGGLCEFVGSDGDWTQILLDFPYSPDDKEYSDNYNALFIKYVRSDSVTTYLYDSHGNPEEFPDTVAYTDTRTWNGAVLAQMDVTKCGKREVSLSQYITEYIEALNGTNLHEHLDKDLTYNGKTTMKMSNYICMYSAGDTVDWSGKVYASWTTKTLPVSTNSYVQLSGSLTFHEFSDDPYPIPEDEVDIKKGKYKIKRDGAYLKFRLTGVADGITYSWNGETWSQYSSTFGIPYIKDSMTGNDLRADALMFKELQLKNTNTWRQGLEADGYTIPIPVDWTSVKLTLWLYGPPRPEYDDKGKIHKPRCVFLKDFKFNLVTGDPTYTGILDTDTVYTNVINERFVSEMDEISFKTCTYDDKKPAYSSVMRNQNYLREYHDYAVGEAYSDTAPARAEEHCIRRYANQYSTPAVILEANARMQDAPDPRVPWRVTSLNDDRVYVLDSYTMSYQKASVKIRLVEKK